MGNRKQIDKKIIEAKQAKKNLNKLTQLLANHKDEIRISLERVCENTGHPLADIILKRECGTEVNFIGKVEFGQVNVYSHCGSNKIYKTSPQGLNPATIGAIMKEMRGYQVRK